MFTSCRLNAIALRPEKEEISRISLEIYLVVDIPSNIIIFESVDHCQVQLYGVSPIREPLARLDVAQGSACLTLEYGRRCCTRQLRMVAAVTPKHERERARIASKNNCSRGP